MKTKLALLMCLAGALAALVGTDAPLAARAWNGIAFHNRSAAKQLPRGLTLPSSDLDLKVSSLVAADLDADGDLDIVAAGKSTGSLGILVWVNDGAGRLTRKEPAKPKSVAAEPASPTIDCQQSTLLVSLQPSSPAVATSCAGERLARPAKAFESSSARALRASDPSSLGSRAPPLRS